MTTLDAYEDRTIAARHAAGVKDPAVSCFEQQLRARHVSRLLCRIQQRLENRILVDTGIQGLTRSKASGSPLLQTRIDARRNVDEHVAYPIACEAEALAVTAELNLLDAIPAVTATSLAGVVAKLEMIVDADREIDAPTDFPWPHLASVLRDLKAIAGSAPTQRPDRAAIRADIAKHWEAGAKLVAALKEEEALERLSQAG